MKLPQKSLVLILGGVAISFSVLNFAMAKDATKSSKQPTDPAPPPCWCCIQDKFGPHVIATTAADCAVKHGHCYSSAAAANKACSLIKKCWCCMPGRDTHEVVYIAENDCKSRGGHCYATKGEALRACPKK